LSSNQIYLLLDVKLTAKNIGWLTIKLFRSIYLLEPPLSV